jgi:hypothetical protein
MIRVSVLAALIAGGVVSAAPAPQTFHRPLVFEPNQGQAPAQFQWLGQSSSYQVLLDSESATIVIPDKTDLQAASNWLPGTRPPRRLKYNAVRMKLAGSRPWRDTSGSGPSGGVSNYLNNRDLKRSVNRVPQYGRVTVANVYEGIDLIFYTNGGDLEYDFAVAPGANPEQIQVVFDGTKDMRVDPKSGDLVVTLPGGSELRQLKPGVFQQAGNKRVGIAGGYKLLGQERAAFTVAGYDRSHALVIDPRLTIARSIGGIKDDQATAIAVDGNGNTYFTGFTFSMNFPTTDNSKFQDPKKCGSFPFDPGFCGSLGTNAFVAKVTADGSIGFVTYDGVGSGNGIAVDSSGVYVTGEAFPPDSDVDNFPFGDNAGDLFVQKLALNGQPGYFTFADEPGEDVGNGIALDDLHNAWAVGASHPGAGRHAVVIEVDPNGKRIYKRRFSSTGDDVAFGVAVAARQPWITGTTCGNGFPTTDGIVHQLSHCTVFVLHLDEAGNESMCTVFGGLDGDDGGVAIAMNGSNTVYVTGYVNSSLFPSSTGEDIDPQGGAAILNPKTFITEVESFGRIVRSLVFVAPNGFVRPYAIANDDRGRGVYIAGATSSASFLGNVDPPAPVASTVGFLTKFSPDLSQLRYSVILGKVLSGIALRAPSPVFPEIYVAGWQNQIFGQDSSGLDAFMVKMVDDTPASRMSNFTQPQVRNFDNSFVVRWGGSSPLLTAVTFDIYVSDNGGPFLPFQTATAATSVNFKGMPGHTYGFFSIATDAGGNREPMKTRAEIVVTVLPATAPTPAFTGGGSWDTFFGDANRWNQPQFATTLMFADINGDGKTDVCGRGVAGIWCELSTGTGFGTAFLAQDQFSDANGWNQLDYYASLRFADVNGDGKPDICARGKVGVFCALNNGNGTFGLAKQWDSSFSDAGSWGLPQYGTTMMFADISGDGKADVCGRGVAGIWCELSTGTGFGTAFLAQDQFSDANGWNQLDYYASLRFADVNGDGKPDICGRGRAGVYCALNNGNGTFGLAKQWDSSFSDAAGWSLPQYGTTMMFADINDDGKTDVCGRGVDGIWCGLSTGTGFGTVFLAQNQFSDANGWNQLAYYPSLRFADVNGDGKPDICGRAAAGVYCALAH